VIVPSPWSVVKKMLKLEGSENVKYDSNLDGVIDNSEKLQGKTPDDFAPASHTHSRADITDFWSTPFWSNIPDKPSALVSFTVNDVTSSRSPGTDYTASKPLIVILTVDVNSGKVSAVVDGTTVAEISTWESWDNADLTLTMPLVFAVPEGSTYRVDVTGTGITISRWIEVELST